MLENNDENVEKTESKVQEVVSKPGCNQARVCCIHVDIADASLFQPHRELARKEDVCQLPLRVVVCSVGVGNIVDGIQIWRACLPTEVYARSVMVQINVQATN